ncbi:MAG: hypothetical protein ABFC57_13635 [Veillonellales bacterium]
MKHRIVMIGGLLAALLLGGCAAGPQLPAVGLTPLPEQELANWNIPADIQQQGDGNLIRVVRSVQPEEGHWLELAAGGTGQIEYFTEETADRAVLAKLGMQFLSTQGTGRVEISALDKQGQIVKQVGWIFSGSMPADSANAKWLDARYDSNYKGEWIRDSYPIADLLAQYPFDSSLPIQRYRLSVIVGQGQHAFISRLQMERDKNRMIKVTPSSSQYSVRQGEVIAVTAQFENVSSQPITDAAITLLEPYGYGITAVDSAAKEIDFLAPGEKKQLSWQVKAQRSDEVNLGKAWEVGFAVDGLPLPQTVMISVTDHRPGRIFYVMTEDLEPIDSAGYPTAWGNGDGWLEPEEFKTQMVDKAEALNRIAEKHGAKWTHYIAWPAVRAAEWAAGQSTAGQWTETVTAICRSVENQAARGHEYGVHMHTDYDPNLPGNVLSFNPAVDGLWANHLKHGWAHSVSAAGDFSDPASRTGLLYVYQRILAELTEKSPQGQLLTSRAGSFDFGSGADDQSMSTAAYRKVGLWGSSDADGNIGGMTAGDYGREIYFAAPEDINHPAADLSRLGLVEFRPTPRDPIMYNNQTAAVMNGKADAGIAYFTGPDGIKPGVHAIIGFTHAMFVMGQGDWRSTEGGQFQAIDDHLAYLEQYAAAGRLTFATASQLVRAYLDYYTPQPVAVYGKLLDKGWGWDEYEVDILGRDIPRDAVHPHRVAVKYPLYLRDSAYRIAVLKNGQVIYSTFGLPTPGNDMPLIVDDGKAVYSMKVYHNTGIYRIMTYWKMARDKVRVFCCGK